MLSGPGPALRTSSGRPTNHFRESLVTSAAPVPIIRSRTRHRKQQIKPCPKAGYFWGIDTMVLTSEVGKRGVNNGEAYVK